jgi:hypothetical protein
MLTPSLMPAMLWGLPKQATQPSCGPIMGAPQNEDPLRSGVFICMEVNNWVKGNSVEVGKTPSLPVG